MVSCRDGSSGRVWVVWVGPRNTVGYSQGSVKSGFEHFSDCGRFYRGGTHHFADDFRSSRASNSANQSGFQQLGRVSLASHRRWNDRGGVVFVRHHRVQDAANLASTCGLPCLGCLCGLGVCGILPRGASPPCAFAALKTALYFSDTNPQGFVE